MQGFRSINLSHVYVVLSSSNCNVFAATFNTLFPGLVNQDTAKFNFSYRLKANIL